MNKSKTTQFKLEQKEQDLLKQIDMMCTLCEGEFATSTPDFIDKNINQIKNLKTLPIDSYLSISLIKRLTNIKEELLKKQK